MTEDERVKQKYPDAQCQWTSRGWRVWTGNIDDGIVELGRTSSAHVPELEAWADASRKMGNEFVDDVGPMPERTICELRRVASGYNDRGS